MSSQNWTQSPEEPQRDTDEHPRVANRVPKEVPRTLFWANTSKNTSVFEGAMQNVCILAREHTHIYKQTGVLRGLGGSQLSPFGITSVPHGAI